MVVMVVLMIVPKPQQGTTIPPHSIIIIILIRRSTVVDHEIEAKNVGWKQVPVVKRCKNKLNTHWWHRFIPLLLHQWRGCWIIDFYELFPPTVIIVMYRYKPVVFVVPVFWLTAVRRKNSDSSTHERVHRKKRYGCGPNVPLDDVGSQTSLWHDPDEMTLYKIFTICLIWHMKSLKYRYTNQIPKRYIYRSALIPVLLYFFWSGLL